ncbi:MAG: nucleotidyltransferase family protein [Deltaproteobacteria bacterium]
MIAILLCAGFATRMYPLTKNFPKPLLDVGGRPALDYLIDRIAGLRDLDSIYVVTNKRFFHDFLSWGEKKDAEITERGISLHVYNDGVENPEDRLGAVGDLGFLLDRIRDKTGALVAAGDNIFRFSLEPYWEKFLDDRRSYVFAVPTDDRERIKRTGVLEMGPDKRVSAFHEKPAKPPSNLACPAIYFLAPEALELTAGYLIRPDAGDEIGLFISYLVQREKVYAFYNPGEAVDIGTIESYQHAKEIFGKETADKRSE